MFPDLLAGVWYFLYVHQVYCTDDYVFIAVLDFGFA